MVTITRGNVAWTITGTPTSGNFVGSGGSDLVGDPWVVGPVTVTAVSPAPTGSTNTFRNGSVVNPTGVNNQGWDGRMGSSDTSVATNPENYQVFSSGLPVTFPITLNPGDTLVSSISTTLGTSVPPNWSAGNAPMVGEMQPLTVLAAAPASAAFRPSYCGGTSKKVWLVSDLNMGLVPSYTSPFDPVGTGVSNYNLDSELWSTPTHTPSRWLNAMQYKLTKPTEPVLNRICPAENQNTYPADHMRPIGQMGVMAATNHARKLEVLYKLVQMGIDIEGCWNSSGYKGVVLSGAGYGGAWYFPLVLAGHLLNNPNMIRIANESWENDAGLSGSFPTNPDVTGVPVFAFWERTALYSANNAGWSGYDALPKPLGTYFRGFPLWGDAATGDGTSVSSNDSRRKFGLVTEADLSSARPLYASAPLTNANWTDYGRIAIPAFISNMVAAGLLGLHKYYPQAAVDFFYRWINDYKLWFNTTWSSGHDGSEPYFQEIYGWGGSGNLYLRTVWDNNKVAAGCVQSASPPTKHKAFPLPNGKRMVLTNQGVRMF